MARFLDTRKCAAELSDLIRNTGADLTLISPYLQLSKDFRELLSYRSEKGKKTTLVFREQKLNSEDIAYLQHLLHVTLRYHEDLHAKCYINGNKMIITSMNLYKFSMDNNKEMGVLIEKSEQADVRLFEDAMKEVQYILDTSKPYPYIEAQKSTSLSATGTSAKVSKKNIGYCIRTGVEIPFNLDKPLSPEAYKKWNEFANPNYPENFCHYSGEPSQGETSMNKPILKKYWKKAHEVHKI
jgi:phosphatidylserine/phosphatidylglycerophosphate/cardiolipin synthase-like enzyme